MNKKLLVPVLLLAIIVSGFVLYGQTQKDDSANSVVDTSQTTIESPVDSNQTAVIESEKQDSTGSRSNLLLDRDKNRSDFSFVTILRGLLGMLVLIGIAWVFSTNRKAVSWKVVGTGLLIQVVLALGVLYVPFIQAFFFFF